MIWDIIECVLNTEFVDFSFIQSIHNYVPLFENNFNFHKNKLQINILYFLIPFCLSFFLSFFLYLSLSLSLYIYIYILIVDK